MLSEEEIKKAKDNLLRGNDIESACLIMEEVIWNGLVITGGRVNITKVAMRQILNFIEEYKNKSYLDVVKEKVKLKEKNNQLEQENKQYKEFIFVTGGKDIENITATKYVQIRREGYIEGKIEEQNKAIKHINKQNKIIDEMSKEITAGVLTKEQWCPLLSKGKGCYKDDTCLKCLKQYFEEKVEEKNKWRMV